MSRKKKDQGAIELKLSTVQLEDIIIMLLNNPTNRKFMNNVSELIYLSNDKSISNDIDKQVRVDLITRIVKTMIEIAPLSKAETLEYVDTSGRNEAQIVEILNDLAIRELTEPVERKLAEVVSRELQYGVVDTRSQDLQDYITNFQAGNYENVESFMDGFAGTLSELNKDIAAARDTGTNSKEDVNMNDAGLYNFIEDIIEEESSEQARIRTGVQLINQSLDGGWQRGRLYVALGLAKGWKSSFLLNAALWAKKFNNLTPKDPTKKPVIVYLTMENSTKETMVRLWAYAKGNHNKLHENNPAYVSKVLRDENIITPDDPNSPEIIIWSRNNKSISTADLDVMLEDLAKEGKEPVFLIQDYLKRIRSSNPHKELRLELGQITDEFVTIARKHDIPFLTAGQLNRDSFRDLNDSDELNKQIAAISRLGVHNVGESIDIVQNCDFAFIIGRVEDKQYSGEMLVGNDRFLVFKNLITRGKSPEHSIFLQRFPDGYDLKLDEDVLSKESKSIIPVLGGSRATSGSVGNNHRTPDGGFKTAVRKFR